MVVLQTANLALRLLLELVVLCSVGYWGFRLDRALALRVLLGIGAPLLVAVIWAAFGAPQAAMPATGLWHLLLELVVFGSGPLALYAAGRPTLASALGVATVLNRLFMYIWGQ